MLRKFPFNARAGGHPISTQFDFLKLFSQIITALHIASLIKIHQKRKHSALELQVPTAAL